MTVSSKLWMLSEVEDRYLHSKKQFRDGDAQLDWIQIEGEYPSDYRPKNNKMTASIERTKVHYFQTNSI